ncbi:MAG: outer membrane beta-barrel protein [Betaproteobacteria bacterium]
MTRTVRWVLATALTLLPATVWAQVGSPGDSPYYVGIGGGPTKMKGYCKAVNATAGFVGTCDESTVGFKAFAGYKLNRNFGLELGFSNFGEARADGTVFGAARIGRWKGYGVDLSAVAFLPLGDRFEVFAKGGVAFWDVTSTLATTASQDINDRGFSGVAGAGVIWWVLPQVGLRMQYERFQKVGDDSIQVQTNIDYVSLNVVGRF